MQEIKVAEHSVDCSPPHHVIIGRKIRSDSSAGGIAPSQKVERPMESRGILRPPYYQVPGDDMDLTVKVDFQPRYTEYGVHSCLSTTLS